MGIWITVVETESYRSTAETFLMDEERAAIADMIAADPTQGDVMTGIGGLCKVRVPLQGPGEARRRAADHLLP